MKNPNDLRVLKTRERLVNAYLQLLINNTSDKVLNICSKANITAMTFYHHFEDKIELIRFTINQQLRHILPIPTKLKPSGNKQLFNYLIKNLSLFFINNKEVLFKSVLLMQDKGYKYSYLDIFNKTIIYNSFNEFKQLDQTIDFEIKETIIKWFVGGLIVVLISNIINNKLISYELLWKSIKLFASIINNYCL